MSAQKDNAQRVTAAVKRVWWAFMLRGVLALVLAACALLWPEKTMGLLIKLLGGYFVVDGVAGAVGAFRTKGKSFPAQAIVSLTAGLALLFWTGISAKLFLIVAGVWALLQGVGIFLLRRELEPEDEARGLTAVIGAIVVVIGLVFIFWPKTGIVAITWLIAVGAFVVGGLLVFLATRLRRVKTRIENIGT